MENPTHSLIRSSLPPLLAEGSAFFADIYPLIRLDNRINLAFQILRTVQVKLDFHTVRFTLFIHVNNLNMRGFLYRAPADLKAPSMWLSALYSPPTRKVGCSFLLGSGVSGSLGSSSSDIIIYPPFSAWRSWWVYWQVQQWAPE